MLPIEKLIKKRKWTGREAGQLFIFQNMQAVLAEQEEEAENYVSQDKFNKIVSKFASENDHKILKMYSTTFRAIMRLYENRTHEAAAFYTGMELLIETLKEIKNSAELMKAIKEYEDSTKQPPEDKIEGMNLVYRLQEEIKTPKSKKIRAILERAKHTEATADKGIAAYILVKGIGFFECNDGKRRENIEFCDDYQDKIAKAFFEGYEFPSRLKELANTPETALKISANIIVAKRLNLLSCENYAPIGWEYASVSDIKTSEYDVIKTLANGITKIKSNTERAEIIDVLQNSFPELFAALSTEAKGGLFDRAQNAILDTFTDEYECEDEDEEEKKTAISSFIGNIESIAVVNMLLPKGTEIKHYTEKNTKYIVRKWAAFNATCTMIETVFDVTDFSHVFCAHFDAMQEKITEYNNLLYNVYGIIGGLYGDYGIIEENQATFKKRIKATFEPLLFDELTAIFPEAYKKIKYYMNNRYREVNIPYFENINDVIQTIINSQNNSKGEPK